MYKNFHFRKNIEKNGEKNWIDKEYATSSSYSAAEWNGVTVFQFDRVLYTVGNVTKHKNYYDFGLEFECKNRTDKYGNITR